jgi:hypothetical protein
MPNLRAEREMAYAMLGQFGDAAAQRASDNAHLEALLCDDSQAAYWRRVTALIIGFQARTPDMIAASA